MGKGHKKKKSWKHRRKGLHSTQVLEKVEAEPLLTGGLDEVGWGSIAGPIISVAAVFNAKDLNLLPPGVKDSKKLSPSQIEVLYLPLCKAAVDVGVGHAWPWEIDKLGPYAALQLSYSRALKELKPENRPHILYVDGKNEVHWWRGKQVTEPKADNKYKEVAAASIIAKYFRDSLMTDYAKLFPEYEWGSNKGYECPAHAQAIVQHGLLIDPQNHSRYIHRRKYTTKYQLTTGPVVVMEEPDGTEE